MCGIAGIIQYQSTCTREQLTYDLSLMSEKIRHRGPDDSGIWVSEDAKVGLAHRRLSIVDLSEKGHQPMHSHDQRFVLTFNGEIYNYQELRLELESKGITFNSDSDSEVLIECYREYGEDCLTKFDGMFAFVLYDQLTKALFAARDAFGEKPFYYSWYNGRFVFASELSAIAALPDFKCVTDLATVSRFLCLQYVAGEDTFYQGASKLLPGHYLKINQHGESRTHRYFEFNPVKSGSVVDEESLLDELEQILLNNIRRRLRADVPVGAFLSGGLDSSLVVALATKKLGLAIQTFTIGFAGWPESEHMAARATAAYLGTHHVEQMLKPDCYDRLDDIVEMVDEPNGDTSLLPTFLLSQLARKSVKVVLSGDGADELFGGYGRYFATLAEAKRSESFNPGNAYYSNKILTFSEVDLYSLLVKLPQETCAYLNNLRESVTHSPLDLINRLRKTDIENYLPGAVLAKVDRMSMRNALEVRTPFLNIEMARFVERLPPHLLADEQGGKYLLKRLAARYLPQELINKPKKGFGIPQSLWGEDALLRKSEQRLLKPSAHRYWWLNQSGVTPWIDHGKKHGASEIYKLWSIYHVDKFIERNGVSSVNQTNPVHVWMLEKKLLGQMANTLILSVFPASFVNPKLSSRIITVSVWQVQGSKLVYQPEADWIADFEKVFKKACLAFNGPIKRVALLGTSSSELYKNAAYLTMQKLTKALVFEDSMWQEHAIKPKKGWRLQVDKLYPAVFSIQEKTFVPLSSKELVGDLGFFVKSTLLPFIENPKEDPFVKEEKRQLLDKQTPLRAFALLKEVYYAFSYLVAQKRFYQRLSQEIAKGFIRQQSHGERIIFVLPSLYSGGAERQACNLMVSLKQQGKDVRLLSISPLVGSSAHYLPMIEAAGIHIIDMSDHYQGVPFEEIKRSIPEARLNLLAYDNPIVQRQIWPVFYRLYSENPHNVVCFLDTPNLIGGIAAALAGVPKIVTSFRNTNPTSFSFYEPWYDPYYQALIQSPQLVMTGNSTGGNRSYADWLKVPIDSIHLLRNGVDFSHYSAPAEERVIHAMKVLNYDGLGPLIGGVFRLSEEKRPELFIDIFYHLRQSVPNLKGFIAGEGPLKAQLEKRIKEKQLEDALLLVGPVKDVSPFIAISTLILQTSRTEGTANSLLEAQYLKVPVIATEGGGVDESFADGQTGWLLKNIDAQQIALQVESILRQPDVLRERGLNGHEFVIKHFSLPCAVQQLLGYCHF